MPVEKVRERRSKKISRVRSFMKAWRTLTDDQRLFTAMRCEGFYHDEISDHYGVSKYHVEQTIGGVFRKLQLEMGIEPDMRNYAAICWFHGYAKGFNKAEKQQS